MKKHYCLNCHKRISNFYAKRCKKCSNKYAHKRGKTKHYCIDCNIIVNFYAKRCHSCDMKNKWKTGIVKIGKGKKSHSFKTGKYTGIHRCIDCKKSISYKSKRCKKCFHKFYKGKKHFRYIDGRSSNINYVKIYKKNYSRERNKHDIKFKISNYLRTRIWCALKSNSKSARTMKLVGCSLKFFKLYLEKRFKEGMNWNNWGRGWNGKGMTEWHIDHIKPCASFDLSKPSEQRKCFNYKNLQPMWAEDNHRKLVNLK